MANTANKQNSQADLVKYFQTKLEAEWGPYDLKHALDEDARNVIVLDTRSADAYETEHIQGAINIPGDELDGRLDELPRDKAIVPYCWTAVCHLATRAALLLAQKGYVVHELAGGIQEWKNYEFPIEPGKREPALAH